MAAPDPADTCPACGLTYGELRTDLSFGEVRMMLWTASTNPADWKYKRRHTVLGLWMSIKRDLWTAHLAECRWYHEQVRDLQELGELDYDEQPDDFIPW